MALLGVLLAFSLYGTAAASDGTCAAAGFENCCSLGNNADCRGHPGDCYCDSICYEYNDCCSDIQTICAGTFSPVADNGTCSGKHYTQCCVPGNGNPCHGSDGKCYCDQSCHFFGDCCTDIEQYCPSVNPSNAQGSCRGAGYESCCNPQPGVICWGSSGNCYCDELCYTYNDCCYDAAIIGCLAPTVSPTVSAGSGSCLTAGYIACCVPSATNTCVGSNGICSCSADCYDSGTCCNDISALGCAIPTPTISPCKAAGYAHCCHPQTQNGSTCIGNPPICYCDLLCYSFGDCCSDVSSVGCAEPSVVPPAPNGTCAAANYKSCCQPTDSNPCLGYPGNCYCDEQCHQYGDCCDDILDIGCQPSSIKSSCLANYTSCCLDEDLSCVGYPEPNCYCDQACTLRDDCCHDQSLLSGCTELAIPGPVNNLMAMSLSNTSFYVMWDPPTHPNGVSHYVINVSNYSGSGENKLRVQLAIQVLQETVTQLLPFKPYNVTVYGINIKGKGLRKQVINFTQEGAPTQAPDNIRVSRSGSSLTISWSPISLEAARGFPMYMVQYFPSTNIGQVSTLTTKATTATITGVNPRVKYGVQVAAFTKGGGAGTLSKTMYEGGSSSPRSSVSVSTVVGVVIAAIGVLGLVTVTIFVVILIVKRRARRSGSHQFKKLLSTANDDVDDDDDDDDSYNE